MKEKIFIYVLFVIVALACHDEQLIKVKSHPDLLIKSGTICGWCTVNDTLTIHGNLVKYVNYTECNTTNPIIEKIGNISNAKIDSLLSDLDFNEFRKIELNTCNVCFDGCDNWLYIELNGESHYIRYTGNESKLEPIKGLLNQLNDIKNSYQ